MKHNIIHLTAAIVLTLNLVTACAQKSGTPTPYQPSKGNEGAVVYFTDEISAEALVSIYEALGVEATGRVAVKISTGESQSSNQLDPALIMPLVQHVNGTLVECNTAYPFSSRAKTASHLKAIEERGYGHVDIMDAEGTMRLPVADTTYIKYDEVGSHLANYDFMIDLSHFKGHAMGGFGGALKNLSIGVAARSGKFYIHSAGATDSRWKTAEQEAFLECMATAADAVQRYFRQEGRNIIYINIMNNLSVDCDCDGHPAAPCMKDVGILASTDPVALDKACLDLVFGHESTDGDDAGPLQERINRKHGTHIITHAERLGTGTSSYRLVILQD
jgi:uncharacterized Fe-S center protein